MQRPEKNEYAPHYETYIGKVPDRDIFDLLSQQIKTVQDVFKNISEEKSLFGYAQGKWTIKQLLGHVNDVERIFAYRALRFSRNDKTALPGFEQDEFINQSNFNNVKLSDLVDEFVKMRESNIAMFKNFSEEMWTRRGTASKNEMSTRAVPYVLFGHAQHHLDILKERYL